MAETLTVTIDDGGTYTVNVPPGDVALFTDANLTTPATFPAAIAADTTWYAAAPSGGHPQRRHITVYISAADGTQVVTPPLTQLPATISASEGTVSYSAPSQSGGSSAGATILRGPFPFTFDTPGLVTGHEIYTPTPGDWLINAWIEVTEAWDGTTPKGDINQFLAGAPGSDGTYGLYSDTDAGVIDMTRAWHVAPVSATGPGHNFEYGGQAAVLAVADTAGFSVVPGKFLSDVPVSVVVSQDGTITGADPGSTQGAGNLWLITATPVAPS